MDICASAIPPHAIYDTQANFDAWSGLKNGNKKQDVKREVEEEEEQEKEKEKGKQEDWRR